jgi:hypothetical protein
MNNRQTSVSHTSKPDETTILNLTWALIENNSMENQVENYVDVFCFWSASFSLRLSYIQIFFVIGDDRMGTM